MFPTQFLQAAAAPLVESDAPRKADAVLVLGGDEKGTRILRAGELVRAGYAPYAFVSGPEAYGAHESDFTVAYALKRGFAPSDFRAMPNDCSSTQMEASKFGGIFRQNGFRTVLLVTSNFHTHRAAAIFRRQNPGLQVVVVPAADPYFTVQGWWKTREGRKTFALEWSKTLASWLAI